MAGPGRKVSAQRRRGTMTGGRTAGRAQGPDPVDGSRSGPVSVLDVIPGSPRLGAPSRTCAASPQPRVPEPLLRDPARSLLLFRTCTRGRSCAGAARAGPRKLSSPRDPGPGSDMPFRVVSVGASAAASRDPGGYSAGRRAAGREASGAQRATRPPSVVRQNGLQGAAVARACARARPPPGAGERAWSPSPLSASTNST